MFTNRETGTLRRSSAAYSRWPRCNRPARILWEQSRCRWPPRASDWTAVQPRLHCAGAAGCRKVTVFHDMQHKRHPEHFRWFDLPAWRALFFASAVRVGPSDRRCRRQRGRHAALLPGRPEERFAVAPHGVENELFAIGNGAAPWSIICCASRHCIRTRTSKGWCGCSRGSASASGVATGARRNARVSY